MSMTIKPRLREADGGGGDGGGGGGEIHSNQFFADIAQGILSPDFANHLGDDIRDGAADLNQRFGGQPLSVFAKSYRAANKTISEGGRPIGYPASDAPEGDWAKYRAANGIPENPEDMKLFDELPEGINEDVVKQFQKILHEADVSPRQARMIAEKYHTLDRSLAQQAQEIYEAGLREHEAKLRRDLGPEYEDKMQALKGVLASQGFKPDDPELFDNPKVIRFGLKMLSMIGEDTIASLRQTAAAAGAFTADGKSIAMQILGGGHELSAAYADPGNPEHQKAVRKVVAGLGGDPSAYDV